MFCQQATRTNNLFSSLRAPTISINLLNTQPFGFRPGYAKTYLAPRVIGNLTEGFNLRHHVVAVLLDASAAFDAAWIKGLLYKMIQLRFPKGLIALLQSYLTNRQFKVTVDGSESPT